MPSPLYSFFSAAALGLLDLGLLAWAANSLGAKPSGGKLVLLSLLVLMKLGILAGGFALLARQAWFLKPWGMGGLLSPFAMFVLWQALVLQRRFKERRINARS